MAYTSVEIAEIVPRDRLRVMVTPNVELTGAARLYGRGPLERRVGHRHQSEPSTV